MNQGSIATAHGLNRPPDDGTATRTWAVVATIRAPREMVDVFISHYLRLGADEVHLFFDDPALAEYDTALLDDPRLIVKVCDDELWSKREPCYPLMIEGRPSNVEGRQFSNYLQVQRDSRCDWILNVDVDELLIASRSIPEILCEVPKNVFMVGAKTLEAVYTGFPTLRDIFDTKYFKQCHRGFPDFVASEFSPELLPNEHGFWGHRRGKGFFRRTARIMTLSCHFPKPLDHDLIHRLLHPEMELLHFECMTFELFHEKRVRRITGDSLTIRIHRITRARLKHFKTVLEQGGEPATRELYRQMNVFSGQRLERALDAGFLVERDRLGKCTNAGADFDLMFEPENGLQVDVTTGIAVAGNAIREADGSSHQRLRVSLESTRAGLAYLYYISRGRRIFMVPDERGELVEGGTERAHFFKYKRYGAKGLHLYSGTPPVKNRYLALRNDGRVGFEVIDPGPQGNLVLSRSEKRASCDTETISMYRGISDALTVFLQREGLLEHVKRMWIYRERCLVVDFTYRGVGFNFDFIPSRAGTVSIDIVQRRPASGLYVTPSSERKARIGTGISVNEALCRLQENAVEVLTRIDALVDSR